MSSPLFRFLRVTGLGALAAFIYGLLRSARREPTPPTSGAASWEPLVDEDPLPTRSGPVTFTDTGSATAATGERSDTDETVAETDEAPPEPEVVAPQGFAATGATTETTSETGWVEPDAQGGCPDSHPIKGNAQSQIFHVPGGMSYERTKAERCYCDEASAEADGFRKAKR
ncbi:MAG: hypothetical protein AAGA90_18590 [Actinomycetota bacterium]